MEVCLMGEVVDELPPAKRGGAGRPPKYPWDVWLDGKAHRLIQRVVVPGEMALRADGVMEPVLSEGDFELEPTKMQRYARKKVERMKGSGIGLRTRVDRTVVEVEKGDGTKVKLVAGVLYLQAVDKAVGAGRISGIVGEAGKLPVTEVGDVPDGAGEDGLRSGDAADGSGGGAGLGGDDAGGEDAGVLRVSGGGLPAGVRVVRQSEMDVALAELAGDGVPLAALAGTAEAGEDEDDEDDWEVISPEEDEDDPFAGLSDDELAAELAELERGGLV
jgi:hypothetical protein